MLCRNLIRARIRLGENTLKYFSGNFYNIEECIPVKKILNDYSGFSIGSLHSNTFSDCFFYIHLNKEFQNAIHFWGCIILKLLPYQLYINVIDIDNVQDMVFS